MKKTKNCKKCKKEFTTYKDGAYCSIKCYLTFRWGTSKCNQCGKNAPYRFCSVKCRKDYWNTHDYQVFKKKYHWDKKIQIIKELGGKCIKCGVDDIRILDINHIDRTKKQRPKHRIYSWTWRIKEWRKNMSNLEILCANCHRIHTWEQMNYGIKNTARYLEIG